MAFRARQSARGRHPAKDTYPPCSPPCPTVPGGPARTAPVRTRRAWSSSRSARAMETISPAQKARHQRAREAESDAIAAAGPSDVSGEGDDDIRPSIGVGEDGIARCACVRLRAAEHGERRCTRPARVESLQDDAATRELQVV